MNRHSYLGFLYGVLALLMFWAIPENSLTLFARVIIPLAFSILGFFYSNLAVKETKKQRSQHRRTTILIFVGNIIVLVYIATAASRAFALAS